jgi:excisionase family DNA binding protein
VRDRSDERDASDDIMTRPEAASYMKLPRRTLDAWAYRGEGPPFFKIGRHTRYRRTDVDAWLETRRQPAGAA